MHTNPSGSDESKPWPRALLPPVAHSYWRSRCHALLRKHGCFNKSSLLQVALNFPQLKKAKTVPGS
jgi:hypothetical protein